VDGGARVGLKAAAPGYESCSRARRIDTERPRAATVEVAQLDAADDCVAACGAVAHNPEPRSPNLSSSAFTGTAEDYARYRPRYPDALFADLLARLPARTRLLDLACGPGRVALHCAPLFDEVWAVDIEPEMVALGKRLAAEQHITNVRWQVGPAEKLEAPKGAFDLITIGEAFHRLDQHSILQSAQRWLVPDGWLASLGSVGILQGRESWQVQVTGLARQWTKGAFPQGWAMARPGSVAGPVAEAQVMSDAGFRDVSSRTFHLEYRWSIEQVLGYLRSTSVCSWAVLGDERPAFEDALTALLRDINPDGWYSESIEFGYTAGRCPASSDP
jgi:ubiquinone/menaquinone biosynthesis C-methylase UbiE